MLSPSTTARDFPQMTRKNPGLRILVVDDEALIRWSLSETLADCGHDVMQSSNAQAARCAVGAAAPPFDVVLLDYRMADSEDLNLLASIRELSPSSQVVLMTAFGTPEIVAGALGLGAFRVVDKPLEMYDVPSLVEQAHNARRAH
jgi:DNA-binding NtrC family response regulator